MIPDIERVVSRYLRDATSIQALGARLVGKTPDSIALPWVRVTMLAAQDQPTSRAERLIDYMVQLDCYAGEDGGQPQANLIARTVRAVLWEMPGVQADDVVVSSVRFEGMARIPDTEFEPARERVALTAHVHAHA